MKIKRYQNGDTCPCCGQVLQDMSREELDRFSVLPVRCRDCRKNGLLECPLVRIERQQLVFINHDPDWFCGDAEEAAADEA